MEEFDKGEPGDAFTQAVLAITVNTGLVSHMVEDCYNCALAHAVCYGLDRIPGVAERFLHGDLVGYGILIQLAVDERDRELNEVCELLRMMGIPVSLKELGVPLERCALKDMLKEAVSGPDMEHIPYVVTEEMVWDGICRVEALGAGCRGDESSYLKQKFTHK